MRKHKGKTIFFGLLLVVATLGFIPWSKQIPFSNGGYVRITPASFFNDLRLDGNASSTISYHSPHSQSGKIVLWADLFDGPVMVMPSTESNVLLCLYDYDISLRLFRIDTSKKFTPLSPNNSVNRILFSSTWDIDYATSDEWKEVLDYVKNVSPNDFARQSVPVGICKNDTPDYILGWVHIFGIPTEQH